MRNRSLPTLLPLLVLVGSVGCANGVETNAETTGAKPAAEQAGATGAQAPGAFDAPRKLEPEEMPRLKPAEVQPLVRNGEALLVCAYDSDEKFDAMRLEGAIPYSAFEQKLPGLGKDALIVFY